MDLIIIMKISELFIPKMMARWAMPKRPKVMAIYSAIKLFFLLYSQQPNMTMIIQKTRFKIVTGSRTIAIIGTSYAYDFYAQIS